MSTVILDSTPAHDRVRASTPSLLSRAAGLAPRVGDLTLAAVSAGVTAFVFYTTAGVPLLIAVAGRLGLDAAHTSSWFFIVFFSTAITSIALSLVYRQPLPINWSLPGLLYLGSLAGHFSFPELIGANVMAGVVIVVGGLIGTLAGGWLADKRALKTPRAHLEVGIAGFLAGAVLVTIAILSPLNIGPIPVFVPMFLLAVVALYLYSGPFTALSQNVVSPGQRASAVTALLFIAHVFGDSHSPFDVGLLSDWLGGNLQLALLITSPTLLILAAVAAATGLRTVKQDTEAAEEHWAAKTATGEAEPALSR